MTILHKEGFSLKEMNKFRAVLFNNCVDAIQLLVRACNELGYSPEQSKMEAFNNQYGEYCKARRETEESEQINPEDVDFSQARLPPELASAIVSLWGDPSIQKAFYQQNLYHKLETTP
jgi:hypothetical protein